MARLIYGMGEVSHDGYVAAADGRFSWTEPGAELHRHAAAELDRAGTLVYGRKMYDLMVYWETADRLPDAQPADIAFATAWQRPDKIVASRTLTEPRSARTRIVADLSPDSMRQLKASASGDISLSGPTLASELLNAGIVDEVTGYFTSVVVGGGLPMFKDLRDLVRLELTEEVPIEGGFTFRRFAVQS